MDREIIKYEVKELKKHINNVTNNKYISEIGDVLRSFEDRISRLEELRIKMRPRDMQGEVIKEICLEWGISRDEMFSRSRKSNYVQARQTAIHIFWKYELYPTKRALGLYFGFDHSTVIWALDKAQDIMSVDLHYKSRVNAVEDRVFNKELNFKEIRTNEQD